MLFAHPHRRFPLTPNPSPTRGEGGYGTEASSKTPSPLEGEGAARSVADEGCAAPAKITKWSAWLQLPFSPRGRRCREATDEGAAAPASKLALALALIATLTTPALATDYPLTVENCGTTVTFESPPQRVVAIKSTATEMLLALGLADRIVGLAFQDGPVPDQWAADAEGLKTLADRLPSQEIVLEAEPDFVFAGWESNFAADGAGERDSLHALGVATYVAPTACRSEGSKPEKISFDLLFDHILEVGRIFDVEARAEALVAEQRAQLASLQPVSGLTALWYSSGTGVPYVGAGLGGPQMTMEALGLANIMADLDDTWASASWEAVVDADPDVLILVDAAWNSFEQKTRLLAENPATSNLTAVENRHYLTIPFPAAEPGIRSVPATLDLAAQLKALDLTP